MEFSPHSTTRIVVIFLAMAFALSVSTLSAETYRWKDKDGNVHYGAMVPAEYAEQPYDILNNAGVVIEHIEDTSVPLEIMEELKKTLGRQPLISEEERKIQADKLLVIQYTSEEDIIGALNLEIAQLGYDSRLIDQSYESTSTAIRDQIRQAADQQRAGQQISAEQLKDIASLYARRGMDEQRRSATQKRADQIRTRFAAALERYRFLTSEKEEPEEEPVDQG